METWTLPDKEGVDDDRESGTVRFVGVTVLFADIVDFTRPCSDADPVDVVNLLNSVFSDFDDLAEQHGLEKIKTIGDAYMVAGGLLEPRRDHCEATAAFALDHGRIDDLDSYFRGDRYRNHFLGVRFNTIFNLMGGVGVATINAYIERIRQRG